MKTPTHKIGYAPGGKELRFGVDDEYADKGIKSQGVLIADYEFKENKEQNHIGIFKGKTLHQMVFELKESDRV